MTVAIGAATTSGQLTATGPQTPKMPSMFDKPEKSESSDQQRLALAHHTGKGLNIDIRA